MAQPSQSVEELKAKIAKANADRVAKQASHKDAVALRRLENEASISDVEARTGLTLGIDLGVVWCPDGSMALVGKPDPFVHERFALKVSTNTVTSKDIDEFVKAAVVYPEALKLEALWTSCPGAKSAAANIAMSLCEAETADIEGKS